MDEMMHVDELVEKLCAYCDAYELDVDEEATRRCVEHFMLVVETNKVMNLTRITNEHDGLVLHILDSLLLLPEVRSTPYGTLLDIGTGAGYPGIPLTLATGRPSVLIDSVAKKVKAVAGFIDELQITDADVSSERVETYAREHRASCTCVVARAVAALPVLIEYASPLLAQGGSLVVTKGVPSDEEVSSGLHTASLCGFEFGSVRHVTLPDGLGDRTILRFDKLHDAKLGLPRKVGVAKKHPLGA